MRTFLRDHWKAIVAIILLIVLAMFTVNPGAATPRPSLAARLRAHVAALAPEPACSDCAVAPRQLDQAARYVEATLREQGYAIRRPAHEAGDGTVRKVEVSIANLAPRARPERIFIVGARVGPPAGGAGPDAGGKGAGGAAVLELARLLKNLRPSLGTEVRFVFLFGDAPAWPGGHLGARFGGRSGARFDGHASGQMRGRDFIAFVGTLASSRQVQQALAPFQGSAALPAHGLAIPAYVQGVTLSSRAAGGRPGDPAIMVTDTAFGRYPFHEATNDSTQDAPDEPDYAGMARVVSSLAHTIRALAAAQQS